MCGLLDESNIPSWRTRDERHTVLVFYVVSNQGDSHALCSSGPCPCSAIDFLCEAGRIGRMTNYL